MNRRAFVMSIGAGLLLPRSLQPATPVATPLQTGRPDPADLGEGITLIDYRVHPGERAGIIGELRNNRDEMVDSPVVSLTFPRGTGDTGFAWASAIIPVIPPGGTVPMYGTLPRDASPERLINAASFALCSPVAAGEYTKLQHALNLELEIVDERFQRDSYRGQGVVTNLESHRVNNIKVRGIIRDANGRVEGMTSSPYFSRLMANESAEFVLWGGRNVSNKANPLPLLTGPDYSAEIVVTTHGPVIAPGCSFGQPWD